MRFGITDEMRQLRLQNSAERAAPPSGGQSSMMLVLTAFLTSFDDQHAKGSFARVQLLVRRKYRTRATPLFTLTASIDDLLSRNPALCSSGVRVHAVHDVPGANDTFERNGVEYHRFAWHSGVPPDVFRWLAYRDLLARMEWDCVFAIDLFDVQVFWLPRCDVLPPKLVLASDTSGTVAWLHKAAQKTWLLNTTSSRFRTYLNLRRAKRQNRSTFAFNCGVAGGTRPVFEGALRQVTDRFLSHYTPAVHPPLVAGADMVVWNELAQNLTLEGALTGYPHGPASYPMLGSLAHGHCDAVRFLRNSMNLKKEDCRRAWLNRTRGLYWFGHKVPGSWFEAFGDPSARRGFCKVAAAL